MAGACCSAKWLPHLLKGVLAGPDHILGHAVGVRDVAELAALERECSSLRFDLVVALVKVRIFLIFSKVCDEELAPMASLCCSKALDCAGTLPTEAHLEETTIRSDPRSFHLRVVNKINRMRHSIVSTEMSIHIFIALIHSTASLSEPTLGFMGNLLNLIFDGCKTLFAQEHVFGVKAKLTSVNFVLVYSKAHTRFIFSGNVSFVHVHLLPQREEVGGLADAARNEIR